MSGVVIYGGDIFAEVVEDLYNMVNEKTRLRTPMISDETYKIVMEDAEVRASKTKVVPLEKAFLFSDGLLTGV